MQVVSPLTLKGHAYLLTSKHMTNLMFEYFAHHVLGNGNLENKKQTKNSLLLAYKYDKTVSARILVPHFREDRYFA